LEIIEDVANTGNEVQNFVLLIIIS